MSGIQLSRSASQVNLGQLQRKPPTPQLQRTESAPTLKSVTPLQKSPSHTINVESQIQSVSPPKLSVNQKILDTSISLSDISGEFTAQAKLKDAFQGLKSLFKPSANKIKYKTELGTKIKTIDSTSKDLFLMKYNPLASSKDKQTSRDFDAFTYKEFSNENTEFLKFSRKLVSMGADHPNFEKHLKTGVLHFIREGSQKEINISSPDRKQVMKDYNAFIQNPSTENKASLLKSYNKSIQKVYQVMGDTKQRFDNEGSKFTSNVKESKAGRLWKNFKADHKNWWSNRKPWSSKSAVASDFSNFFKSWGSFSKVSANFFFMQTWPDSGDSITRDIGGVSRTITGSSETVRKDKEAYLKANAFNSGLTVPTYDDYNL